LEKWFSPKFPVPPLVRGVRLRATGLDMLPACQNTRSRRSRSLQPTCYPCDYSPFNEDGKLLDCSSRFREARTRLNSATMKSVGGQVRDADFFFGYLMSISPWSCLRRSRRSVAHPALAPASLAAGRRRRRRQRSWPLLVSREGSNFAGQPAKRLDACDYSRCRRRPYRLARRLIIPFGSNSLA